MDPCFPNTMRIAVYLPSSVVRVRENIVLPKITTVVSIPLSVCRTHNMKGVLPRQHAESPTLRRARKNGAIVNGSLPFKWYNDNDII